MAVAFVVTAVRTHTDEFPGSHARVTGQCKLPVEWSAHRSLTAPEGISRNGDTQIPSFARVTIRVRFVGTRDEAFQHNCGADLDTDHVCTPPAQTAVEETRATTPVVGSTHTETELGIRFA